MKSLLVLACLFSISALPASAQAGSGGGRRGSSTGRPRLAAPDLTPNTMVLLSGKVVVDDGSVLTDSASIQTICRGQKRTETHTDSHGYFTIQFGSRVASSDSAQYDADTARGALPGRPDRRDLQDCDLQASLAGFTSDVIPLGGRFSGYENADIGRVVLHRLTNVEGFTISATSAQAPANAKKALEKGQDQQKKDKWDDAEKSLEKAVALYPKFAVAWFELGRVQLHKNDPAAARHSFQQSLEADPKYINPYHALTQLAQHEQNWQDLTNFSEKLLALNPVNFPDVWFSNAIAHYYLQNFAAAEKSARRGLQVDTEHRIPKLDYLLAVILMNRSSYDEAAQHLRAFLSHVTKPNDVAEGQKQLDEIARLTAAVQLTTGERK